MCRNRHVSTPAWGGALRCWGDAMSQAVSPPRAGSLSLGVMPRGLSRVQAAEYIGVSPTKFDELVGDGRMPKPKRVDAWRLWDTRALDRAFDWLDGEADAEDAWGGMQL